MARKGKDKTPKIDPAIQQALTPSASVEAASALGTAIARMTPDQLVELARAADVIGNERDAEAEARQSELRFEGPPGHSERGADGVTERWKQEFLPPDVRQAAREVLDARQEKRDPFESSDDMALDAFLTEDEKQAPFAAVLTSGQLQQALNGEEFPADAVVVTPQARAVDDGPLPFDEKAMGGMVELSSLWTERLVALAKKANQDPVTYLEGLIKRQWIASGGGRG